MESVRAIIRKKPAIFLITSLVYLILVGLLKWRIQPPVTSFIYIGGGLLGIYFLDIAEEFFHLTPSPFRSIIFAALFVAVSFFIITSSGSLLASGLVLSLFLTMILWQAGELRVAGNLNSWYRLVTTPVTVKVQQWMLVAFVLSFLIETLLFIR